MSGWRNFRLRFFGARIGINVLIRPTVRITYPWKLAVGDHSWVGDDVVLYSLGNIVLEDNVVVSQKSYLCAASHDYSRLSFDIVATPVVIKREAWIATDVFIGPGVVVGAGSLVGARSSVFQDVPSGAICAGSPARVIGNRSAHV